MSKIKYVLTEGPIYVDIEESTLEQDTYIVLNSYDLGAPQQICLTREDAYKLIEIIQIRKEEK